MSLGADLKVAKAQAMLSVFLLAACELGSQAMLSVSLLAACELGSSSQLLC